MGIVLFIMPEVVLLCTDVKEIQLFKLCWRREEKYPTESSRPFNEILDCLFLQTIVGTNMHILSPCLSETQSGHAPDRRIGKNSVSQTCAFNVGSTR